MHKYQITFKTLAKQRRKEKQFNLIIAIFVALAWFYLIYLFVNL